VPSVALPFATPFTSQAISVPAGTHNDAVNTCVWPSATVAVAGEIEFEFAQVIVTLADADLVPSPTLVAVIVTTAGDGGIAGAV